MQKRDFNTVFSSYFHGTYSLKDFYNTKLIDKENIEQVTYNKKTRLEYKRDFLSSMELKSYHTFLNSIIFNHLQTSNNVYSYKKNFNILKMIKNHKDKKFFFKTDIHNFFSSIDSEMIKKCIYNNLDYLPVILNSSTINFIVSLSTFNNTLPMGLVSSPSISNAVLYDFDVLMEQYCNANNIVYSRYSDDLVFSSDCEICNLELVIENILYSIYGNKFELNKKKSKYFDKTKRVRILGLIITPDNHITVPKIRKKNIKKLLYFYLNNDKKFSSFLNTHYNGSHNRVYSELNYINDIDDEFIKYLKRKYGRFVIDKFLHGDKN